MCGVNGICIHISMTCVCARADDLGTSLSERVGGVCENTYEYVGNGIVCQAEFVVL